MKKLHLDVRLKTPVQKVTKDDTTGKYTVHLNGSDEKLEVDKVLIALGRPPNVKPLGLE